ncbi:hypothetical protein [Moritella sp. 28]|uniref:hypothetical protein n=1 Tax=Moritella sp. 28 TaxID=2746232 RepID=UPI001BAA46D0|nr:hypothetical protein [Moritella sp. 28]QUM86028.1 hypothetical protein HWV02_16675 [Moritella sp. 28]
MNMLNIGVNLRTEIIPYFLLLILTMNDLFLILTVDEKIQLKMIVIYTLNNMAGNLVTGEITEELILLAQHH